MSVQLDDLITYQFLSDDTIVYSNKSLPVYKESFGSNEYLTGMVDDATAKKEQLLNTINRKGASELTPVVQGYDDGRTQTEIALKSVLETNIRRRKKIPVIAAASEKLLTIINLKCPNFPTANDNQQTVMLDTFQKELQKDEFRSLTADAKVDDIVTELFEYNDNFKTATNQRSISNSGETAQVKIVRLELLHLLILIHDNLEYCLGKNPNLYAPFVEKINRFNSETMATIRGRTTREQNIAEEMKAKLETTTTAS
jgi:hypothetical protein